MLKLLLYLVSLIYSLAVNIRNFLFDIKILKSTEFKIPVIGVGNISVGGTGKTPHVEYIISLLEKDYKIAILSRGYKRKTKGFLQAKPNSTIEEIGDEAKQIKQKFPNITVAVSESRVKGVQKLLELNDKIELVILDDAFQHRYIKPGLMVLMSDYNRPFWEDNYLPYGRLRESPFQKHRANIIVISKTSPDIKSIEMRIIAKNLELLAYQKLFFTTIKYEELEPVFSIKHHFLSKEIIENENYDVLIVTGIANPNSLVKYIKNLTNKTSLLQFSDHHKFKEKDIKKISEKFQEIKSDKKIIITTEKDAMRFREIEIPDKNVKKLMFYIPIKPVILKTQEENFKYEIVNYIKRHNTDYKFFVSKYRY